MQIDKEQKSLKYTEALLLALVWLIVVAGPIVFANDIYNINWDRIFSIWIRLIPFFILFLINHFILVPFLFFKKKNAWYFGSVVGTLILFVSVLAILQLGSLQDHRRPFPPPRMEDFNRENISPNKLKRLQEKEFKRKKPGLKPPNPMTLPPNLNSILIAILIIGFDTGLRTVFKWTKSEQDKEILEKEKVKSELAFLRNQVSPHFFMNTLNNIHALIDIDKEEAKESIIRLSKLMRHLIYDSEGDKIKIKKEVEFIKNYVELMKLRFTDKVKVKLDLPKVLPNQKIPPLLFTSFIENAFKHGVSYNARSFINVKLLCGEKSVDFEMQNSNFSVGLQGGASGIGLENIKKRLDLLYESNYKLVINDQSDIFEVKLSIPI